MFPLDKMVRVTLEQSSWSGAPPQELQALQGMQQVSLCEALLQTAYLTRPPTLYGFHLSDVWAWLRYLWAFESGTDLRLRSEWSEIDSHQKTVMSDDLGVGFTMHFLVRVLGLRYITDTRRFLRLVGPEILDVVTRPRRGPSKTPDFVAFDGVWNLYVIECKGTQTNHSSLREAIARGVAQKSNVGSKIRVITQSLVAGLFIPQYWSQEEARIHIADPDHGEFELVLSEYAPEHLALCAKQLELARTLACLNLPLASNSLSERRIEEGLPNQAQEEIRAFIQTGLEDEEFRSVSVQQQVAGTVREMVESTRFQARLHISMLRFLAEGGSVDRLLQEIINERVAHEYRYETTESQSDLYTPLGLRLRLTLLTEPG